jgi:hypothetical protein
MEAALDGCPKFKISKTSGIFNWIEDTYIKNSGACAGKAFYQNYVGLKRFISARPAAFLAKPI